MTKINRIKNILFALVVIVFCVITISIPSISYILVLLSLCLTLFLFGMKKVIYYFTMARHMVGGESQLFIGVIVVDLAVFATTLADIPKIYIAIYIAIVFLFSGFVSILRAFEEKKNKAGWKGNFITGIIKALLGIFSIIAGIVFKTETVVVYIYCFDLMYNVVLRLISSFKKTAIIYIQ